MKTPLKIRFGNRSDRPEFRIYRAGSPVALGSVTRQSDGTGTVAFFTKDRQYYYEVGKDDLNDMEGVILTKYRGMQPGRKTQVRRRAAAWKRALLDSYARPWTRGAREYV